MMDNELLQQAEQLTTEIEGNEELPRVERSLGHVLEASQELHSTVIQSGTNDIQAHLLESKGLDLQQITQKLESLSAKRTFEPLQPIADSEIETSLENERENARLDSIETTYARQVEQYNKLVFHGRNSRTTLHQKFAQVAEELNDAKVKEMWEIIKTMFSIPALTYQPTYHKEDLLKVRSNPTIQQCLIAQGKKYLERRYKQYINDVVCSNPMRGAVTSTYPLVRGFVGLRLQGQSIQGLTDGIVDDRPVWPMVYYCLRSGDYNAALHCLRNAGRDHEEFIAALKEHIRCPEIALSDELQTAINFQYRVQVRNSTDPFKRAVYCVIGGCDVSDEHTEVARTAYDHLWLKLSLFKSRSSNETEAFTYSDLQKLILEEYGETHYHAYEKPFVYFQVLALTGQFEPAIEFLSRIPRYQVHGVHIALALHDMYMLVIPRNVQAPLLSVDTDDPAPLRRLNIHKLLLLYVRKFELSDISVALHYYFFLRKIRDTSCQNLFIRCCSDLVLKSRDYELLFGKLDADTDMKTPGLLDQFKSPHFYSKHLPLYVAEQLVAEGLFEDAITIYDIAGNQERVLDLFCMLLAQVVNFDERASGLRRRLSVLSDHVSKRVRSYSTSNPNSIIPLPASLVKAYNKLCKLMTFFDQYHSLNFEEALETMRACSLVPLALHELEPCVAAVRCAHIDLLRCLPEVMFAVCRMLVALRSRLRGPRTSAAAAAEVAKQLECLREQAAVVNMFAGNIADRNQVDTKSVLEPIYH